MGSNYLDLLAADLLDAALDGLHESRTGIPAPGRVYTAHSIPAVDACIGEQHGQLTVHLAGLRLQSVTPRGRVPRVLLIQPIANFAIQLWRCHPSFTLGGDIPTADALDDAAGSLLIDLWCVMTQLMDEHRDKTLFPSVNCERVEIGDPTALGPQGSAAGWMIPVTVALGDGGPDVLALQPASVGPT